MGTYMQKLGEEIHELIEREEIKITIAGETQLNLLLGNYCRALKFKEHWNEHHSDSKPMNMSASRSISGYGYQVSADDILDEIEDEISGAKQYHEWFKLTGDKVYLAMAKDECRHGEILLSVAEQKGIPQSDTWELKESHDKVKQLLGV